MKKLVLLTFVLMLAFAVNAGAIPPPLFDVWQDTDFNGVKDTYLGSIYWYTGPHTDTANFNYYSASAHPLIGPNPEAYKSKMFFYAGSNGVSFNFFHNIDNGGNNYWNHVGRRQTPTTSWAFFILDTQGSSTYGMVSKKRLLISRLSHEIMMSLDLERQEGGIEIRL